MKLLVLAACALLGFAGPALAQDAARDEVEATLSAIVRVKAKILPDARTAATLGMQREGNGVLVRPGYVATIGYLVIEAESIEVTGADGKSVPASIAAYDHASGFGLLALLAPLDGRPLPLGDARTLAEHSPAMIASFGGRDHVTIVHVVSRRPFSGSWEYLLDAAIYTSPPVLDWSGAALIGPSGELLGVGSLILSDAAGGGAPSPGNLFVPVDLLKPVLDELVATGRRAGPARPWLGMNTEEFRGRLFVVRVSPESPAARAGIRAGDIVIAVGREEVSSLPDFYRKVWSRGAAGVEVPVRLLQGAELKDVSVRSIDRLEYFRTKRTY